MTRTEKWKEKREHIEVMNKYMTRFDHLRMAYEKPKYEPKHAYGSRQRKDNA